MTNHTLSPAAQAVLDAYRSSHLSINNLAAALRAAADQCDPEWLGLTCVHSFYAIADELEGIHD